MNILIVKLSALGDVVQSLPTFEAIRQHYPAAHISWLVEDESADVLLSYPGLDEVIVCPRRSWLKQLRTPAVIAKVAVQVARFCRCLRQRHYDIVVDLQGLIKSGIWVGLARGRRKIGFARAREGSWIFLNERLPPYDLDRHALERYLDVARYLGARVTDTKVRNPWLPKEEARFASRLRRLGEGPIIAMHPLGRWPSKLWPEENFAHLAREVVARVGASVVFTGSRGDRDVVSRIIDQAGASRIHNWAGIASLREVGYLYRNAAVVVAVDSGPMHLAAAIGTPVLALFGPTAPWRTGPFGPAHRVLRAEIDCSPCFQETCTSRQCMKALGVDQVLEALVEMLGAR